MPLDQLIRAGTPAPSARWGELVLHRRARPVTRFDADLWSGDRDPGSGHLARCLQHQHETDHLAGIVMEDRLSAKLRKRHRAQHADVADAYPASWPT